MNNSSEPITRTYFYKYSKFINSSFFFIWYIEAIFHFLNRKIRYECPKCIGGEKTKQGKKREIQKEIFYVQRVKMAGNSQASCSCYRRASTLGWLNSELATVSDKSSALINVFFSDAQYNCDVSSKDRKHENKKEWKPGKKFECSQYWFPLKSKKTSS